MNWIAYSGVTRNQHNSKWWRKALLATVASTVAAVIVGGLLGWAASAIQPAYRMIAVIATLFLLAILLITGRAAGVSLLIQRNTETKQSLLDQGPTVWAVSNGALLGLGFASRLGSWLWYVIPVSIVLAGSPRTGVLIYGAYGFARLAVPSILAAITVLRRQDEIASTVHRHQPHAVRVADAVFAATVSFLTVSII